MSRLPVCCLALALVVWSASPAPAEKPAASWPFYAMDTAKGSPDLLKELGYAGESGTLSGNARTVANQVAELDKRGLKLYAVYVGGNLTKEGLTFDPALPDLLRELKGRGTVIWLHLNSKDFKKSSPEGDAVAVPALGKLAGEAAAAGLPVAVYPHLGDWTEKVQDGLRLARQVDRPNYGVCFNLCHCLAVGDEDRVTALVKEAGPYLKMVTLNGADAGGKGWGQLIQPVGKGTYDLKPLLRALREAGYTGPIGFQAYGIQGDRRELLTATKKGWKEITRALAGK